MTKFDANNATTDNTEGARAKEATPVGIEGVEAGPQEELSVSRRAFQWAKGRLLGALRGKRELREELEGLRKELADAQAYAKSLALEVSALEAQEELRRLQRRLDRKW